MNAVFDYGVRSLGQRVHILDRIVDVEDGQRLLDHLLLNLDLSLRFAHQVFFGFDFRFGADARFKPHGEFEPKDRDLQLGKRDSSFRVWADVHPSSLDKSSSRTRSRG